MSEIEGTIEAISYRTKAIKVNGKWYNVTDNILKNVNKGDKVKIVLDDLGNVLEVKKIKELKLEDKVKILEISSEILKLIIQTTPVFTTAEEIDFEKNKKKILKELFSIAEELEKWILK